MRSFLLGFFIIAFIVVFAGAFFMFFRTLLGRRFSWKNLLNSFDAGLTFFENWTLFTTVMVGLVSLIINVILRYGFNYALAWSEELIRHIIIYTTFIGCSAAIKNRNMITIDALPQMVPRLKVPLTYVSHLATLVYSVVISIFGYNMALLQAATHQKTIILQIPLVILYCVLPLMGVMMFIRTIQIIYEDVNTHFVAKEEPS